MFDYLYSVRFENRGCYKTYGRGFTETACPCLSDIQKTLQAEDNNVVAWAKFGEDFVSLASLFQEILRAPESLSTVCHVLGT